MTVSREMLNGHAAVAQPSKPAAWREQRKVWRATIKPEELEAVDFANAPDQWECLKGILKLKGIPKHFLNDGSPVRMKQDKKTGVITVEFVDP